MAFPRWVLVVVLAACTCWTANLTLFNWWAAGGPPTPNAEAFRTRGNLFALVTVILFGAALTLGIETRRLAKRRASRNRERRGADEDAA